MATKAVQEEAAGKAKPAAPRPPLSRLIRLCLAAWLIPGAGHYLLGRKWRALILFTTIVAMFVLGLLMQGSSFLGHSGSYLETLGYWGEMCVGVARPAATFFGYAGGNPFFASADYGTAYLISAGMLNVLAILDSYDIALGRKP
jgi:hypothetical protein